MDCKDLVPMSVRNGSYLGIECGRRGNDLRGSGQGLLLLLLIRLQAVYMNALFSYS